MAIAQINKRCNFSLILGGNDEFELADLFSHDEINDRVDFNQSLFISRENDTYELLIFVLCKYFLNPLQKKYNFTILRKFFKPPKMEGVNFRFKSTGVILQSTGLIIFIELDSFWYATIKIQFCGNFSRPDNKRCKFPSKSMDVVLQSLRCHFGLD